MSTSEKPTRLSDMAVMAALEQLNQRPVVAIPESTFLPFVALFSGTLAEEKAPIQAWLTISKSPYNYVEVYEDNTFTNLLFTIPPIFERNQRAINVDDGVSISGMVIQAKNLDTIPAMSNAYMRSNLANRVEYTYANPQNLIELNKMLSRYDLPTIEIPLPEGVEPEQPQVSTTQPIVEFSQDAWEKF